MTDSKLYQNNFQPNGELLVLIVLVAIALMFGLSSCTPSRACRKWAKEMYKPDTHYVRDTIRIPEIKVDTHFVMKHDSTTETFYVDRDRLHIEIQRVRDTLLVKGRCDSIIKEVIKEVKVGVSQPCTQEGGQLCFELWWLWVVGGCIGLALLFGLALKIKNI
jgi:hypothetical protein